VHSDRSLPAEEILYGAENLVLTSVNTIIRIFSSQIPGNGNENSLCVLFDTENCDILITGDRDGFGERMLLRKITDLDIDVLVAGHHGSKYATCEELLTAVRPEIVCISAGRNNSFGHPAPELLQRLDHYGCSVYRTDLQGNIIIRR
jgi:competence protein ComEC